MQTTTADWETQTKPKGSRKLEDMCISRMYANVFDDGHVNVTYVTAHTNHMPGLREVAYLPLPNSTRQEIALKLANGQKG